MLTARQYAELIDTPYPTVMSWLQRELIPGAKKEELPIGGWFYQIPADAPKPLLRRGPTPKKAAKPTKKARKKGSDQ